MIIACMFDAGLICIPTLILCFLFPSIGLWLKKKFNWCKKSCKCKTCHGPEKVEVIVPDEPYSDPILETVRHRINDRVAKSKSDGTFPKDQISRPLDIP